MKKKDVNIIKKQEYWLGSEGLLLISAWAREGLSDSDIAKRIGVSEAMFRRWRRKNPKLLGTAGRKREITDIMVENALLKRALGYEYEETKRKITEKGEEETITVKQMPPDLSAISIWLKNRRPEKWREKNSDDSLLKKLDSIIEEIDDAAI